MSKMVCVNDFEEYAEKHLDPFSWTYYSQGAERELTLKENLRSYSRYVLIPRVLRNSAVRDLSVTVLGERLSFPVGIAPTGFPKEVAPAGWEIAAAKAASEVGTVYTLGVLAPTSLEDVCRSHPKNFPLWLQIYQFKSREITAAIVRGAEAHGYKALVLTCDMPVIGLRLRMLRQGRSMEFPKQMRSPTIDNALKRLQASANGDRLPYSTVEDTLNWNDIRWLKSITKLPIILKGILSVEDAIEAVKCGASAVWVSNHGGRQLDGVPSTLEVLPGISSALEGSGCEVYADGGVRWGSDVFKMLALGARAVFIGRAALWGLAHSHQDGLRSVLEILKVELDLAMHLTGCKSISDIGPQLVRKLPSSKM